MDAGKFSFEQVGGMYFPEAQLRKIRTVVIGIAGAGGLGSNCAVMLMRLGFENLIIADFDRVECTNLNRQHYFSEHIGRPKVDCLKEQLARINPAAQVEAHRMQIDAQNFGSIYSRCHILVEAFDTAEAKAMVVGAALSAGKKVVSASGLAGYGKSDRIVTRKVSERLYMIGDETSGVSETVKPHAPCVNIAAAKQADAVLSLVLGIEP